MIELQVVCTDPGGRQTSTRGLYFLNDIESIEDVSAINVGVRQLGSTRVFLRTRTIYVMDAFDDVARHLVQPEEF